MKFPAHYRQILPIFFAFSLSAFIIAHLPLDSRVIALILGVIAGGLVDMDHRVQGRILNLIPILGGFALVSFAIERLQNYALLLIIFLTLLAFFGTLAAAIDSRYRILGFCNLIVALYILLAESGHFPWYSIPLHLLLGTFIAQGSLLFFQFLSPNRPVQESLAHSYATLSSYIECKARFFAPDEEEYLEQAEVALSRRTGEVAEAFNHTRDTLFKHLAQQTLSARRKRQLSEFFIAQDIHERISANHVEHLKLHKNYPHSDFLFRIERLLLLQARVCREYAQALRENQLPYQPPKSLDIAGKALERSWQYQKQNDPDIENLLQNLLQINKNLHKLSKNSLEIRDNALQNTLARGRDIPERLKQHLNPHSAIFRHAVRMGALSLIGAICATLIQAPMAFWIVLTAVFVCQPNRNATKKRLIERIMGTVLGVIAGALIPLFEPNQITLLILLIIANTLFFYFRAGRYGFSTFFITLQVFIGFYLIGLEHQSALWQRLLDTFIGAALAWICVRFIYPDERYQNAQILLKTALNNNSQYLHLLSHEKEDTLEYRSLRRRVHESAAQLVNSAEEQKNQNLLKIAQINYRILAQLSALSSLREKISDAVESQKAMQESAENMHILATHLNTPKEISLTKQSLNLANEKAPIGISAILRITEQLEDLKKIIEKSGI